MGIIKNVNYLSSYIKREISDRINTDDLDKKFFIFNSTKVKQEESVENILLMFNQTENDDTLKAFINYLFLHESEVELLEELSKSSNNDNIITKKAKIVSNF